MRSLLLMLLVAGCIEDGLVPCGDRVCAPGATCLADRQLCAFPDALAACAAQADGTLCQASGIDGACDRELCVASTCGDGITTGREQCDGAVPDLTCGDYLYYRGELACTSSCLVDSSTCSGSCGDGLVEVDQGELCDGAVPTRGCLELGYDYGHIRCTARCGDTSLTDCGHLEPPFVFAGNPDNQFTISDVWRDTDILVISRGGDEGLAVIDRGVRTDIAGTFGRIAVNGAKIMIVHEDVVEELVAGTLVPLPDIGANGDLIVALTYAPSGELWAMTNTCKVRVLSGSSWQVKPDFPGTDCLFLAIDPVGDVYAATDAEARWLDGSQWTRCGTISNVYSLNEGKLGVLASAGQGGYELQRDEALGTPMDSTWFDAITLGDGYFAVGIAPARFLKGHPLLYNSTVVDAAVRVRRMRDGSVLFWQYNVYEMESLFTAEPELQGLLGARAGPNRFLFWDTIGVYAEAAEGPLLAHTQAQILDAAQSGDTTYVAVGATGLSWGQFGVEPWTTDSSIDATRVWANDAGDLSVIVLGGEVRVKPAGQAWATLPAHGCSTAYAMSAISLNEIYVARYCSSSQQSEIDRWDGAQWTQVTTSSGAFGEAATLDDGTIVFTGASVLFGRDAQWTKLPYLAGSPSGTSKNDIWLGSVDLVPFRPAGLAHWNGTDLAPVRSANNDYVNVVAADKNTVFAGGAQQRVMIARWPVP